MSLFPTSSHRLQAVHCCTLSPSTVPGTLEVCKWAPAASLWSAAVVPGECKGFRVEKAFVSMGFLFRYFLYRHTLRKQNRIY